MPGNSDTAMARLADYFVLVGFDHDKRGESCRSGFRPMLSIWPLTALTSATHTYSSRLNAAALGPEAQRRVWEKEGGTWGGGTETDKQNEELAQDR